MRLAPGDKISITNGKEEIGARTATMVAEEWAGLLGVDVVIVRPSSVKYHRGECSICGKKVPVTEKLLSDMTPEQRDQWQVIRYKDLSHPLGDHLRHVHHTCLDKVRDDASKWPSGLIWVGAPVPDVAATRQKRAVAVLKADGITNVDAYRTTMWLNGKEPACISDLLDQPKPISAGDKVITNNGEVGIALENSHGRLVPGLLNVSFDGTVNRVPRHTVRKLRFRGSTNRATRLNTRRRSSKHLFLFITGG